jgi:hypothetical protein
MEAVDCLAFAKSEPFYVGYLNLITDPINDKKPLLQKWKGGTLNDSEFEDIWDLLTSDCDPLENSQICDSENGGRDLSKSRSAAAGSLKLKLKSIPTTICVCLKIYGAVICGNLEDQTSPYLLLEVHI